MSILVTKSLSRSVLQGGRQVLVLLQSRKQNTYQPALVWECLLSLTLDKLAEASPTCLLARGGILSGVSP